jgi:hypothetical protein
MVRVGIEQPTELWLLRRDVQKPAKMPSQYLIA